MHDMTVEIQINEASFPQNHMHITQSGCSLLTIKQAATCSGWKNVFASKTMEYENNGEGWAAKGLKTLISYRISAYMLCYKRPGPQTTRQGTQKTILLSNANLLNAMHHGMGV